MKGMKDKLIETVEKIMTGKVKEMEKNVVEQLKEMMMEISHKVEKDRNRK